MLKAGIRLTIFQVIYKLTFRAYIIHSIIHKCGYKYSLKSFQPLHEYGIISLEYCGDIIVHKLNNINEHFKHVGRLVVN